MHGLEPTLRYHVDLFSLSQHGYGHMLILTQCLLKQN